MAQEETRRGLRELQSTLHDLSRGARAASLRLPACWGCRRTGQIASNSSAKLTQLDAEIRIVLEELSSGRERT
jgi:hypothetical protein